MAGIGSLQSQIRRFVVTHLSDQDDIRILPQHGPQRVGEGDAGFLVDLGLGGVFDRILDRILYGDDIPRLGIELIQHCIEGGSFAAAGGAADQNHAALAIGGPCTR